MNITASGPILFLIILYVFLRKPRELPFFVVFFAPFSATAIVNLTALGYKSGGLGIGPAMVSLILFIVSQVVFGLAFRPVRISSGLLIQIGLLIAFTLVFLLSLLVRATYHPLSNFQVTQSVYVLLGISTTVMFAFEFCREGAIEKVVRVVRASAIFCCSWGMVQFITWNAGIPYPDFLFNNSKSDSADMFEQVGPGFIRLASVAVEPSFFAASLLHFVCFGVTLIIAEPRFRTRYWVLPVAFAVFMLVLSTSTTAYFGLVVLSMLLLVRWPRPTIVVLTPLVVLATTAIVSVPKIASVLASMTVEKGETSSYIERTAGAIEAIRVFGENPVIGGSWSLAPNYNAVTATLGNVGVIGAVLFGLAAFGTLFELQSRRPIDRVGPNWKLSAYALGIQHALLVSFACTVSSGIKYVVLDDWYFWGFGIAVSSVLYTTAATTMRHGAASIGRNADTWSGLPGTKVAGLKSVIQGPSNKRGGLLRG